MTAVHVVIVVGTYVHHLRLTSSVAVRANHKQAKIYSAVKTGTGDVLIYVGTIKTFTVNTS